MKRLNNLLFLGIFMAGLFFRGEALEATPKIMWNSLTNNTYQFYIDDFNSLPDPQPSCGGIAMEDKYKFFWKFGDGGYALDIKKPTYQFDFIGSFTVTLEITPIYTDSPPPFGILVLQETINISQTSSINNPLNDPFLHVGEGQLMINYNRNPIYRNISPGLPPSPYFTELTNNPVTFILSYNPIPNQQEIINFEFSSSQFSSIINLEHSSHQPNAITPPSINSLPIQGNTTLSWELLNSNNTTFATGEIVNIFITLSVKADDIQSDNIDIKASVNENEPISLTLKKGKCYDPNKKSVDKQIISGQIVETLTYRIDFENVGTAQANTIKIVDKLDFLLDINQQIQLNFIRVGQDTIPLNDQRVTKTIDNNNRELEIELKGVSLQGIGEGYPCESTETTGYIEYSVTTHSTIVNEPHLTLIGEHEPANIYFDNNLPVTTNTAKTQIIRDMEEPDPCETPIIQCETPINNAYKINANCLPNTFQYSPPATNNSVSFIKKLIITRY